MMAEMDYGKIDAFVGGLAADRHRTVEEDVTLLVTDGRGEPYLILYPCKRTADSGWVNSSRGTPLAVMPLQWKPYVSRLKKR
jgi:hypothetical protein